MGTVQGEDRGRTRNLRRNLPDHGKNLRNCAEEDADIGYLCRIN